MVICSQSADVDQVLLPNIAPLTDFSPYPGVDFHLEYASTTGTPILAVLENIAAISVVEKTALDAVTWNTADALAYQEVSSGDLFEFVQGDVFVFKSTEAEKIWALEMTDYTGGLNTVSLSGKELSPNPGSPVPEPATFFLFGAGILGVFGLVRRKKHLKRLLSLVVVISLSAVFVAGTSFAGTITGVKFYDDNDNGTWDAGEQIRKYENIFLRNVVTGEQYTLRTDKSGEYLRDKLDSGKYITWSGIPEDYVQTSPNRGEGSVNYVVTLGEEQEFIVNFGVRTADGSQPFIQVEDACERTPDVIAVKNGAWSEEATWSPRKPEAGDWVMIGDVEKDISGSIDILKTYEIITDENPGALGKLGGLCLQDGSVLRSAPNTNLKIEAESIHNYGNILGEDGVHGDCLSPPTAGSSIEIWATLFINDGHSDSIDDDDIRESLIDSTTFRGGIWGGNGGDAPKDASTGANCGEGRIARAGDGGSVEIYATTIQNKSGGIFSGNGGS